MLSDDEADVRIVIRDTTGILLDVEEGDELTVTGIVSETRSGYRLLPRDQQDLLPRTSTETSTTSQAAAGLLNATKHSGTGGWFISGATVISLFAGAAHHLYKQKKWLFA